MVDVDGGGEVEVEVEGNVVDGRDGSRWPRIAC